ncbi:MAG TPA: hypothetical protein PLQ97_02085 [Myxococcota bacterium]|nr:hypothetical protein [Myxococcota bacterium]HQK50322.1 hypothetical protein [Myxococcota bacterium]
MLSIPRSVVLAALAVLAGTSVVLSVAVHDPMQAEVKAAFFGYLGDLRKGDVQSAARRVWPEDLAVLKSAALDRMGSDPLFRRDGETFFERQDPAEITSVQKERFFEWLLARTFREHPEVRDVLSEGQVIGVGVRRLGGEADLTATLALKTPEGRQVFTMRLHLTRRDDLWFVRL